MSSKHFLISGKLLLTILLLIPSTGFAADRTPAERVSPLLIVENVGQFDPTARFQVWGSPMGAGSAWLTADAIWMVVGSNGEAAARDPDAARSSPHRATRSPQFALKLTFPGSAPSARIEPFNRQSAVISYFIGKEPDRWWSAVPVWGGVRYVDLYPGVDLEIRSVNGQLSQELVARPGADLSAVCLQVAGAEVERMAGRTLWLATQVGPLALSLPRAGFPFTVLGAAEGGQQMSWTVAPGDDAAAERGGIATAALTPGTDPPGLLYGTFLGGGGGYDYGLDIAIDVAGAAYVTGFTNAGDFPATPGSFDPSSNSGEDVFVVKLNPDGSALVYATFVGGSNPNSVMEQGLAIAVDEPGSAYVTGFTTSADFPTTPGALDTTFDGPSDAFVVKLSPDGSTLAYSTFLGSNSEGSDLAVDGTGHAYVTGYTRSSAFPTTPGAFDPSFNGGDGDAYVAKLNPTGSALVYSTFLGGGSREEGEAITVNGAGDAYVTGYTGSADFPVTPGACDTTLGSDDAFVAKLNSTGSALSYGTFLGGGSYDIGKAIVTDSTGSAYITGGTLSSDFPATTGAFDRTFNGMPGDAFVAKLNAAGSALTYASFLGGAGYDAGRGVAVDGAGRAYLAGYTYSTDFPTSPNALDATHNGGNDAFVAMMSPAGGALIYATYLGSSGTEASYAIARDPSGNAYVTGGTGSAGFPTTLGAYDTTFNGGENDAYVVKLRLGASYSHFIWLPLVAEAIESPRHSR